MKRFLSSMLLMAVAALIATAQTANTRSSSKGNTETSARAQGRQIDLQSATQIAAQLESTLDARHAKPGDQVVLKTTQAVKQNGEVVIQKGARLIGHITDVQQKTKATGESQIALVFDRLRSGSTEIPITATIVSITQARSRSQSSTAAMESDTIAQSSTSTRSTGSSNGGLLGGVGNTVGGVLNTTTNTVGNVTAGTTNAVGSTVAATSSSAGNLTGSLRGLQIIQSTDASAQGGSTLSLSGRNLRLESGTTFNLSVSSATSAGAKP